MAVPSHPYNQGRAGSSRGAAGAGKPEQEPVGPACGIQVGAELRGVGGLRQRVQTEQENGCAGTGD
ncbi:hypothetical protein [Streptomyces sp. NPDC048155]|uniref:hypothetical protein n=1 Tax=Streptomyces sp. NPDC048155 TaxID=3154818 RepID=UPI0033F7400B